MKNIIKAVRGTRDIIGDDALKYIYISNVTQEIFENYGYSYIKTPIFEETELFKRGIGEATDVVEKEMYTFLDRGERLLTLRPENTASVVRCYLEKKIYNNEEVSKFYYNGPMFRYERPQSGRQREFNQIGVEVLGEKSPILDAEVISMGYNLLKKLGIKDLEVRINSVGSNESRKIYREKLINYFSKYIDELCDDCKDRINRNPLRLLDCKIDSKKYFYKDIPNIIDSLFEEEKKHYEEVKKYLKIFGVDFVEDPTLVRGLDYYSSTVFEIVTNKLGAQGTVLGGGRYDNLLKELGDKDIPAVGFAAGIERIMMLLEEYPKKNPDVYIAWLGEKSLEKSLELAEKLREKNIKIHIDFNEKNIKNHMKKADKLSVKYCLIIGENELEKNKIILKDFEKREQIELDLNEAVDKILKIVRGV